MLPEPARTGEVRAGEQPMSERSMKTECPPVVRFIHRTSGNAGDGMIDSKKDQPKWDRSTFLAVAVIVLLALGGLFSLVAVVSGWLEEPSAPDGTYPPGPRGSRNYTR